MSGGQPRPPPPVGSSVKQVELSQAGSSGNSSYNPFQASDVDKNAHQSYVMTLSEAKAANQAGLRSPTISKLPSISPEMSQSVSHTVSIKKKKRKPLWFTMTLLTMILILAIIGITADLLATQTGQSMNLAANSEENDIRYRAYMEYSWTNLRAQLYDPDGYVLEEVVVTYDNITEVSCSSDYETCACDKWKKVRDTGREYLAAYLVGIINLAVVCGLAAVISFGKCCYRCTLPLHWPVAAGLLTTTVFFIVASAVLFDKFLPALDEGGDCMMEALMPPLNLPPTIEEQLAEEEDSDSEDIWTFNDAVIGYSMGVLFAAIVVAAVSTCIILYEGRAIGYMVDVEISFPDVFGFANNEESSKEERDEDK